MQWRVSPPQELQEQAQGIPGKVHVDMGFRWSAASYPEPETGKLENGKTGKRENAKVSRQHPGHTLEMPRMCTSLRVTAVCTQDTLIEHLQVPFWHFQGTL